MKINKNISAETIEESMVDAHDSLERVKAAAKEVAGMTLSVAFIVKNEEHNILKAVHSIQDYCDEIIVVDTGSTDKTIEILQMDKFIDPEIIDPRTQCPPGNKKWLYHFEWCDDFSAARNFADSLCTCDYILWMDADDTIPMDSGPLIRAAIKKPGDLTKAKKCVFDFTLINIVNGEPIGESVVQTRMTPRLPEIVWEGRIHETHTESITRMGLKEIVVPNILIYHHGYDSEELKKVKRERNMEYLLREPENAMVLYHLGTTSMCLRNYGQARKYYKRLLDEYQNLQPQFFDHIRFQLGMCEMELKNYDGALFCFQANGKPDATYFEAEVFRILREFYNAKVKFYEYLKMKTINDPWGTKQKLFRFHAWKRLIQIYDVEREALRIEAAAEYPEEPNWK